jgi:hypothetical protein
MTQLQTAVYKWLECSNLAEFHQILADVRAGGADGGFPHFTYSQDCENFTYANFNIVINELRELADNCGDETLTDCLSGFRCLKNFTKSEIEAGLMRIDEDAKRHVFTALSWFALETVASQLEEVA